jgi:thymidylate synthase (FAD)
MRLLDTPKVYMIAEPQINTGQMLAYLKEVGGEAWFDRVFQGPDVDDIPAAEALVEFMGRLCYKSWEPGLNKNVTKIREDRADYVLNVLRSGHGSVIEHPSFSFVIRGGSRVFTAEMNRHRAGVAISEQSLRYVRLNDIEFWMPSGLSDATVADMIEAVEFVEKKIDDIYEREFTAHMDFGAKKALTSKIRRIAPLGLATEEGWSANVRAIRHVIEMRTATSAEEEIRIIADQIARLTQHKCPALFGDYEKVQGEGDFPAAWTSENRKV